MQLRIVYCNNVGKTIDAIVGKGDKIVVLVGIVKRHPKDATVVEVLTANKAKVSMPDGKEMIFNKNRIRLPRNRE